MYSGSGITHPLIPKPVCRRHVALINPLFCLQSRHYRDGGRSYEDNHEEMSKDFPNELEEQADDDEASAQGEYSVAGLEIEFELGDKKI